MLQGFGLVFRGRFVLLSEPMFVVQLRTKNSLCLQRLVPATTPRKAQVSDAVQLKPVPYFQSDALQLLQKSH